MKLFFYCFLFLLAACASQPYFKSPNDVYKKKVLLYLRSKPAVAGSLTVPFEDDFNRLQVTRKTLKFIPEKQNGEENIDISDIIGYSADNNYYALKNLYLLTSNSMHLLFAKRLTGEDSRIQLYELYETGKNNTTGEARYTYFISLPQFSQYETINTHGNQLLPDFDQKMSALVADCPELAEKILNRQPGYFISLFSFETFKHKKVMTKIIDEYNNCK